VNPNIPYPTINRIRAIMKNVPNETNLMNIERSFLLVIKISIPNIIKAQYAGEKVEKLSFKSLFLIS
jgi:hypothetical protein